MNTFCVIFAMPESPVCRNAAPYGQIHVPGHQGPARPRTLPGVTPHNSRGLRTDPCIHVHPPTAAIPLGTGHAAHHFNEVIGRDELHNATAELVRGVGETDGSI